MLNMTKMTRTYKNGREDTGFWLPVRNLSGGIFEEDSTPEEAVEFTIWMTQNEEEDWREGHEGERVVTCFSGGVLLLGSQYAHVNALRVEDVDPESRPDGSDWTCPFEPEEGQESYYAALGRPDKKPATFQVEGYDGEWAINAYPFC